MDFSIQQNKQNKTKRHTQTKKDFLTPAAAAPDVAAPDVAAPDVAANDLGTGTGLLAATGGRGTDFASTGWGRGWVKVD